MNRTVPRTNFESSRSLGPHHYSKIRFSRADKQKMTSLFGEDAKQRRRRRSVSCGCWGRGTAPPGDGRSGSNSARGLVEVDGGFYYRPSVEGISRRYRDADYSAKRPIDGRFDSLPDSTKATAMAMKPQSPVDLKAIVKPSSDRKTYQNSEEKKLPATDASPASKTRNPQMEKTPKAIWEAEHRDGAKNNEMFVLVSSRKENSQFVANQNFDEKAEGRKPAFLTGNLKEIGTESTIPYQSAINSTQERPNYFDVHLSKDNRFTYIGAKYKTWSKGGYNNSSYTSHVFDEVPEDHGRNEALDSDSVGSYSDDSVFISNSEPIYEDMDRLADEQMSRGLKSIQLTEFTDRFESKVNRFEQLNDYSFIPPPPEFR